MRISQTPRAGLPARSRKPARHWPKILLSASIALAALTRIVGAAEPVRTGASAFGNWRDDAPGVTRRIDPGSLPAPYVSPSASNRATVVARPANAALRVPPGWTVDLFASNLERPRTMQVAPNGDIFLAESGGGRIRVFAAPENAPTPRAGAVFAEDLSQPFGIAFWPPGPNPTFVYVAETNRVVRFPYAPNRPAAAGSAEIVVASLPRGGHWTRDIAFSPDGQTMFVSVGSRGNIATDLRGPPPAGLAKGAAWDDETDRAAVLAFDPRGQNRRVYASGLRNCSAMAIQPVTGKLWCAVNERDGLGDDLPPDYAASVEAGAFYGWPWFHTGNIPDPRLLNARPDLAGQARTPEVLLQAHSAPLGIAFHHGTGVPAEYRGDAFVTLRGSWNRAKPTGFKLVRLRFADGKPTGAYEDFLTGFVLSDDRVFGRPVGVAVARDGSLLVSEDGNGAIWRIAYSGRKP